MGRTKPGERKEEAGKSAEKALSFFDGYSWEELERAVYTLSSRKEQMAHNQRCKRSGGEPFDFRFEDEETEYQKISPKLGLKPKSPGMEPIHIDEKITIARHMFGRWGGALRADSGISAQLRELAAKIEASARASLRSGVAEACRQCEQEEGGSCCGTGIEDRYTPELLVINLLLGVTLPESRHSAKSCYFLHERGCILRARDIICINYLCARLQKTIPPEKLFHLQDATGSEMEVLFLLHDRIRNFIRQKSE